MRNTYIENIEVEKAKDDYYKSLSIKCKSEKINTLNSLARITFKSINAKVSSPNYNSAAMDGIQVISSRTKGASETSPKTLTEGDDFSYINTGNQIREPYDSVIMIEDVIDLEEGKIQILKASYPWQHVRQIGEDIVATEMILPSVHKIRPIDIGALLSGGVEELEVYKRPKIGILPTGSEIIEKISDLEDGKIIDSNSRVFENEINIIGAIANRYSPVKDDYDLLKRTILKASKENDVLLINAGSSAGTKDHTVKIIRELGTVVIHGVAMKPGKPTILGIINQKPVIGIPGYPVSAYLVFHIFVKPLIEKYLGLEEENIETVEATISRRIVSSLKNRELVRVNLGYVDGKLVATPLSSGAGVTMSLVKADGIAIIPRNVEGIDAGKIVNVELLKDISKIKETLVSIGSHDLIMDILADMMSLTSGHVGSMGGILAMKRGECHIAPIHLLDEERGDYNKSYVEKYFSDKDMAIIKGVKRQQGFILKKGNPENIENFSDLTKEGVVYANRQRGAGTRVLLDYHLKEDGINPEDINGYDRELSTHMAVATAVKTGSATVGLGIYSAARALDLDFKALTFEDYDFLVEKEKLDDERVVHFIDILKSKEFQNRVEKLGGYEFKDTGQVVLV